MNDEWSSLPKLKIYAGLLTTSILNGFLYAFGGLIGTGGSKYNNVSKLNLTEKKDWENVQFKGFFPPTSELASFSISDSSLIIIFGGSTNQGITNETYILNCISEKEPIWEKSQNLPSKVKFCFTSPPIFCKGNVFIFDSNGTFFVYSLAQKIWKEKKMIEWNATKKIN